jgi:hypothetical protein
VENNSISKQEILERRADLMKQLQKAQAEQQSVNVLILSIDGALQENRYYLGLIEQQEKLLQPAPDAEGEPRLELVNAQ